MSTSGVRGLRHVALKVKNLRASQTFYEQFFGMKVVWQPDPNSVYLSSGTDNLALHQIPLNEIQAYPNQDGQFLDHFGFMMDSPESVKALYDQMAEKGIPIVKLPKQHRDGSYSFYLADPDQNTIQVLYEPNVSRMW